LPRPRPLSLISRGFYTPCRPPTFPENPVENDVLTPSRHWLSISFGIPEANHPFPLLPLSPFPLTCRVMFYPKVKDHRFIEPFLSSLGTPFEAAPSAMSPPSLSASRGRKPALNLLFPASAPKEGTASSCLDGALSLLQREHVGMPYSSSLPRSSLSVGLILVERACAAPFFPIPSFLTRPLRIFTPTQNPACELFFHHFQSLSQKSQTFLSSSLPERSMPSRNAVSLFSLSARAEDERFSSVIISFYRLARQRIRRNGLVGTSFFPRRARHDVSAFEIMVLSLPQPRRLTHFQSALRFPFFPPARGSEADPGFLPFFFSYASSGEVPPAPSSRVFPLLSLT